MTQASLTVANKLAKAATVEGSDLDSDGEPLQFLDAAPVRSDTEYTGDGDVTMASVTLEALSVSGSDQRDPDQLLMPPPTAVPTRVQHQVERSGRIICENGEILYLQDRTLLDDTDGGLAQIVDDDTMDELASMLDPDRYDPDRYGSWAFLCLGVAVDVTFREAVLQLATPAPLNEVA